MTKKILFISHNASRTGAPVFLLNFLRWFRTNANIPFLILLGEGGVLESDLAELAPVLIWKDETATARRRIKNAIRHFDLLGITQLVHHSAMRKRLANENIGLIYSNTVTNGEILGAISSLDCPVISHVHELEYVIRYYGGGLENFERVKQHTQHYIAVSQAVKNNLVQNHEISGSKIDVFHGFGPADRFTLGNKERTKSSVQQQLDIPGDALIVGASGTIQWQKGTDLFVQLARWITQKAGEFPVHFLWVGGESQGPAVGALRRDVRLLGLETCVHFIGAKPNPLDYFSLFDVFALVSREDAFPLVMLEVASLGKPIVCFDNSGGAAEFVGGDCGFVVPYLDIERMADKILQLLDSAALRADLGQQAAKKVREQHDVAVIAPGIAEVIERFL
jgi:glycosyltransferase involved in cell wall biosynthesis